MPPVATTTNDKEIKRHERTTRDYLDGRYALSLAGALVERAVESVCVQDCAPAGFAEFEALKQGLSALSAWWSSQKSGRR